MTPKWFLDEIHQIKTKIRSEGIKKSSDKGAYGAYFTLDQLENALTEHSSENFRHTFLALQQVDAQERTDKFVTRVIGVYVFGNGDDETNNIEIPVMGFGADRNSAEFATGKATTYSKRMFLRNLLGLSQEDVDPENKDQMRLELITSITNKFKENDELFDKANAAWKEKFGVDIDPQKMTLDQLQNLDNKI